MSADYAQEDRDGVGDLLRSAIPSEPLLPKNMLTLLHAVHEQINSHEVVCRVNQAMIQSRLDRIEKIMLASAGGIIMLLGGFATTIILRAI